MGPKRTIRMVASVCMVASTLSVGLVAGATASGAVSSKTTAVWAEAPQANPNYIFPFMSLAFFSVATINQFQYLMFRPLYWFGQGATPNLDPSLSLASVPKYTNGNTTAVVNLKKYKWSNGEQVTSQDVMFWMNMLHAQKANWAAYVPGGLNIPDSLKSVTINSPTQITFTVNTSVNPYWFTYNQLSQISPLPIAWDKTSQSAAAGSGGCSNATYGTVDAQCTAVYTFLSSQSGYNPSNPQAANNALPTYATNPLWQVVDGPWKLKTFDASGNITMVPNPSYSGPVKPTIKTFVEVPFTSDSTEYNALVGGSVDVGYLPTQDITAPTNNALKSGPNNPRLGSYNLEPLYGWAINYFPYNFNSTGDEGNAGKIFSQLYFRQAMQYLVNQPLYDSRLARGYGVPTYGPVPSEPANSFISSYVNNNPYPYSPSKATSVLKSHGWTVVPGGTTTCSSPGSGANQCGAGIPGGAKLAFNLKYAGGTSLIDNTMRAEKSSWAQAGINITLSSATFNAVIGEAVPCPQGCGWEMNNWGAGWIYAPDYYPTGETIFQTGAGSNSGNYSNPNIDKLIKATDLTNTSLTAYENALAKDLPVVWQPNFGNPLFEVNKSLSGFAPANVYVQINPENWRWK
jgi:peptide/nickel transport system substrate-binding protein